MMGETHIVDKPNDCQNNAQKNCSSSLAQNWAALPHSPDHPYFFNHLQFAHLSEEGTKKLKLVYNMGQKIS
jgi:hypothetical protein